MRRAIREARRNLKAPSAGGPFGACIVRGQTIVAVARNTVLDPDATAHAEMNTIRQACRRRNRFDLSDCVMYSTTEPCPMCFSAIHWARIPTIVYGTTIADVKKRGFNELAISNATLKKSGKISVRLVANYLRSECLAILTDWDQLPKKNLY